MPFQRTPVSMVGAVLWLALVLSLFLPWLYFSPFLFLLVCPISCVYCFADARERRIKNYRLWTIFAAIPLLFLLLFSLSGNIITADIVILGHTFVLALYQGNKCLKSGETRSGGRGWDSCKWFAIINAIVCIRPVIHYTKIMISYENNISTIKVAYLIHIFYIIASLLIGLILKKNVKEIGPTCPLETLEKQHASQGWRKKVKGTLENLKLRP